MNFVWKVRFIELIFMIGLFWVNFFGDNVEIWIIFLIYYVFFVIFCLIFEVLNFKFFFLFVEREIVCVVLF